MKFNEITRVNVIFFQWQALSGEGHSATKGLLSGAECGRQSTDMEFRPAAAASAPRPEQVTTEVTDLLIVGEVAPYFALPSPRDFYFTFHSYFQQAPETRFPTEMAGAAGVPGWVA